VIIHDRGHNIPKLISPDIDTFVEFISKRYSECFDQILDLGFDIDKTFKNEYTKQLKQKND
jgi:hypothetical protein